MALHTEKKRSKHYPAEAITDTDYAKDGAFLTNMLARVEFLLDNLEQTTSGIGLHGNIYKTENVL